MLSNELRKFHLSCLKFWTDPLKQYWMQPGDYFALIEPANFDVEVELSPEIKLYSYMSFITPIYIEGKFKNWIINIVLIDGKVTRHKVEALLKNHINELKNFARELGAQFPPAEFINSETTIIIGNRVKTSPPIPTRCGKFKRIFVLNSVNVIPKICKILLNAIDIIFLNLERKMKFADEEQRTLFEHYERFYNFLEGFIHSPNFSTLQTRKESREELMRKIEILQNATIVR